MLFTGGFCGPSQLENFKVVAVHPQAQSKLRGNMIVATKVHMVFRSLVMLAWTCDKRELHMRHFGITQGQHCNNDDNVIHASVWFGFFGG